MSRPIKVRTDWEKAKWIYAHPWRYLRAKNIERLRSIRYAEEYKEASMSDPEYIREFNKRFDREWEEMMNPRKPDDIPCTGYLPGTMPNISNPPSLF